MENSKIEREILEKDLFKARTDLIKAEDTIKNLQKQNILNSKVKSQIDLIRIEIILVLYLPFLPNLKYFGMSWFKL